VDVSNDGWVWLGGENQFDQIIIGEPERTAGWQRQNSIANDTLWGVKAVSATEAWVVGNNGMLLYTDDAGNVWTDKSFISNNLYVVEQIGPNVWIGGKNGFWTSNDNGISWSPSNFIPPGQSMVQLQFTDSSNGWAFLSNSGPHKDLTTRKKTFYKTTNGGLDWSMVDNLPLGANSTYDDFEFIDAQTGWLTDLNDVLDNHILTLYSTTDGGSNWNSEEFPEINYSDRAEVFSLDASLLWLYDYSHRHMKESGKLWNSIGAGLISPRHISFTNENNGFAIAEPDLLYYSQNGGETWLYSGDQNRNKMYDVLHYFLVTYII